MDVYVLLVTQQHEGVAMACGSSMEVPLQWGYEVRVCREGADPADAGDAELLVGGTQRFATRHAAEVAAFSAELYALVGQAHGASRNRACRSDRMGNSRAGKDNA
ncbi:hypothetical protein ACTMU2_41385, partial [Cupriavidus basilensis]